MKAVALLFALTLTAAAAPQKTATPAAQTEKVPPISYICTMPGDEDVLEDKPGKCPKPKCGMDLKPIRLDSVWTCPVHAAVVREAPGTCPLDKRELVQMTMAVSWTCPGTSVDAMNPGTCSDGSRMAKKFTPRAHGNHNPQHGGLFFMAPDNWHHLEGTYPRAGIFRMYLYDDFTKPLPRDQARKITGRIVTKDGATFPLVLAPNGRYLEAKVGTTAAPAEMAAKVKFKADAPENHFDFAFPTYSKEPAPAAPTVTTAAAPSSAPARAPGSPAAAANTPAISATAAPAVPAPAVTAGGADPGLIPLAIPDSVPEMLTQLSERTAQIKRFIDQGAFANVYVPAFQAKDLALALGERTKDLPAERLQIAAPAIKRLVRSAWLLDAFGDIGNREQITAAYTQFADAVKDVESVFPGRP